MIKSSQKFWVVYVRYRFIPEQCVQALWPLCSTLNSWIREFVVSFFDVMNRLQVKIDEVIVNNAIRCFHHIIFQLTLPHLNWQEVKRCENAVT